MNRNRALLSTGMTYILAVAILVSCSPADGTDNKYTRARRRMVTTQIEARGIHHKTTLKALLEVERHKFIPDRYKQYAYIDQPLPIGENQTISQPYIVALMTELLQLEGGEKVLEIGTGSGYQAAILAELANQVFTIEIIELLANRADSLLEALGYENITVRAGDGYIGWESEAPFDAIIVTAAPPRIPPPLLEQLAEGGRMVIPVGTDYQELLLVEKIEGKITKKSIIPVRFVPFTGDSIGG